MTRPHDGHGQLPGCHLFNFELAFMMMCLPFKSEKNGMARRLGEDIFETIYFAACGSSFELAFMMFGLPFNFKETDQSEFLEVRRL